MQYTSLFWAVPFISILLSIAFCPLFAPRFWKQHYGVVIGACATALLFGVGLGESPQEAFKLTQHALVDHYVPFMILVGGLYIIASDIRIKVSTAPSPGMNTLFLGCGALLASLLGTTGAAMVLLRPFMQMNQSRKDRKHQIIFFILLVANIGGCLTPVGDPPLFIGFLNGIRFFWPLQHLALPFLMMSLPLLLIFYGIDCWYWLRLPPQNLPSGFRMSFKGWGNLVCILGVTGLTILTPLMPQIPFSSLSWTLGDCVRNGGIVVLALLSWLMTAPSIRKQNHFDWHPVQEVAKIFAGIFITVGPILNMLAQGAQGPFASLSRHLMAEGLPHPKLFFWGSGLLSAFLDNAPTYLIFFHFAGGNPATLTTTLSSTLMAISCGAVFMGALTYIGNAPNFMVRTMAQDEGIAMPSFFGYMAWSCALLLPLFACLTWLFF